MKAILFGTGWRAMFYVRIAAALPGLLSIGAVYTRHQERLALISAMGLCAAHDMDEALSHEHDIVIVASGKEGFLETVRLLRSRGENVLCETSFLPFSDEDNMSLLPMDGAVAEQYAYTPLFSSVIAALDLIGEADQLYLSGLHNHHAASIARRILHLGDSLPDKIQSCDFGSSVTATGGRGGLTREGKEEQYVRKVRILDFGGKLFINDFSSNQYHSYLFGKRIEVRGRHGIITQEGVSLVNGTQWPCHIPFVFHRDSVTGNGSLTLSHVTLGDRTVFENPFYPANLNDDEIAISIILQAMASGAACPSVRDGVLDARLGHLL